MSTTQKSENQPAFPSKNWSSWHNFMPGSEPALHVKGEVICPTSGYSAELVPHRPPGINPTIYLLDLVVTPPSPGQLVSQVITDVPVHYTKVTRENYEFVTILPDKIVLEVKVVS